MRRLEFCPSSRVLGHGRAGVIGRYVRLECELEFIRTGDSERLILKLLLIFKQI